MRDFSRIRDESLVGTVQPKAGEPRAGEPNNDKEKVVKRDMIVS